MMAWENASTPTRSVTAIQTADGLERSGTGDGTGGAGQNIGGRTYSRFTENAVANQLNPAGTPVASSVLATSLTLTWTAPPGVDARQTVTYQPQVATSPFTTYADIGSSTTALTIGVTGLTTATAYRFRIKASATGVASSFSAHVAQTTA